ncbi:hypothetical protein Rhe02_98800 [Rhizocola hellebori]|uniref:Uncharacterized protein n=1 Tax=Rhizocola hellebori TaxID=1392758 RepID=A0A8J3QLT8_9ACTN|nr:hypothetical protein [Rhizocola hellebori]GIH11813.1 hypothetical protein Rhe02_98800 [Rhizocola hellebori]
MLFAAFVTVVLLPALVNVAANSLPDQWRRYAWIAWPLSIAAFLVLYRFEVRKVSQETSPAPPMPVISGSSASEIEESTPTLQLSAPLELEPEAIGHAVAVAASDHVAIRPSRSATGSIAITLAGAILIFGNRAFVEWVERRAPSGTFGRFLEVLTWPRWSIFPIEGRDVLTDDVRAVSVVVMAVVIFASLGRSASLTRIAALSRGWISTMLAAMSVGFLGSLLADNEMVPHAWAATWPAITWGLCFGILAGLSAAASVPRPR